MQPFGNNLVTVTLTGAQIDAVLEQQFQRRERRRSRCREGFTYTWQ